MAAGTLRARLRAGTLAAFLCLGLASGPVFAASAPGAATTTAIDTTAPRAILVDYETETVLFEKNADIRMPPASLGKLMTSAVVFEALRADKISLDDEYQVSKHAWQAGGAGSGGSTMFAKVKSSIKIDDLIRGLVVQSGNDAAIILAEGMAGSEEAFAGLMNAEARKIGLTDTHFANPTGLDDPAEYTTARDLAKLARYLIGEFPDYYKIYGEPEFTWNRIRQRNRNPLLDMNIGADGLKTGFTDAAGYEIVGSAVKDGRRLILVVAGAKTDKERSDESRKLMTWGLGAFDRIDLFAKGAVVGEARVFGGATRNVNLVGNAPVAMLLPSAGHGDVKAEIVYRGPVQAPVSAGQLVGILRVSTGDGISKVQALYAATDVPVGNVTGRAVDALSELLLGWW